MIKILPGMLCKIEDFPNIIKLCIDYESYYLHVYVDISTTKKSSSFCILRTYADSNLEVWRKI